ncbi:MAG: hypothetical protein GXP63_02895 [DPANN group archaeon]|nr:hypothetical protein [DPANN group archaeon]
MFWEILLAIVIGVTSGIITGLIPGIHINLVSVLLVTSSPFLLQWFSPLALGCFIIAMSVVHTFLDTIPSVFLGAPEADTALGVLPGHRYLMRGNGFMAVKLTLLGSFAGLFLSVTLFPVFLFIVEKAYNIISGHIGWLLLLVVIGMILRESKKGWAVYIFFISGALGYLLLNFEIIEQPLFPLLSGLFGVSTLLISLRGKTGIPPQKIMDTTEIRPWLIGKASLSGQFSGFLTAMLPGLGAATAAVIGMQLTRKLGDYGFMVLLGSISTVNFVLSLATYLVIGKARNGSIVAVKELLGSAEPSLIMMFLAVAIVAGFLSLILGLGLSRFVARHISSLNYPRLVLLVVLFIGVLTLLLSGPIGLLVLLTSTCIGIIPAIVKTARIHGMGCLLLPVMLYFLL